MKKICSFIVLTILIIICTGCGSDKYSKEESYYFNENANEIRLFINFSKISDSVKQEWLFTLENKKVISLSLKTEYKTEDLAYKGAMNLNIYEYESVNQEEEVVYYELPDRLYYEDFHDKTSEEVKDVLKSKYISRDYEEIK